MVNLGSFSGPLGLGGSLVSNLLSFRQLLGWVPGDADSVLKDVNFYLGLHVIYTYSFMHIFD